MQGGRRMAWARSRPSTQNCSVPTVHGPSPHGAGALAGAAGNRIRGRVRLGQGNNAERSGKVYLDTARMALRVVAIGGRGVGPSTGCCAFVPAVAVFDEVVRVRSPHELAPRRHASVPEVGIVIRPTPRAAGQAYWRSNRRQGGRCELRRMKGENDHRPSVSTRSSSRSVRTGIATEDVEEEVAGMAEADAKVVRRPRDEGERPPISWCARGARPRAAEAVDELR